MCGRARLAMDYAEIKIQLRLSDLAPAPNLRPSRNIAPTQDLLIVIHGAEGRMPQLARWGLIPSWAKDSKLKLSTFNARAETVAAAHTFRGAWRAGRRCLVVTDGFYEWRRSDRQPFLVVDSRGRLTILAGLWEVWRSPTGEQVRSCTILTTAADALMAPLHDRMPVVLAEADWPVWLGEVDAPAERLAALMAPGPSDALAMRPVDRRVGNPRYDDPSLDAPVDAA